MRRVLAARRRGRACGLVCLALAACAARERVPVAEVAAPPATATATPVAGPRAPEDPTADLRAALAQHAAYEDGIPPGTLYTWTRPEQIADLRRSHRLLVRNRSREGAPALFDTRLAADPSAIARVLTGPGLLLRRFAWTVPWATLAGWKGETYGDRLLRVDLAPGALVVRYDTRAQPAWSVVDLSGTSVPIDEALKRRANIAAVYHLWPGDPGHPEAANAAPFREYVLCNESMIAHFEYATPAIERELADEHDLLLRLSTWLRKSPIEHRADAAPFELWKHRPPPDEAEDIREAYTGDLAFPNDRYVFDAPHLDELAARVDSAIADNRDEAISVLPTTRFVDQGAP